MNKARMEVVPIGSVVPDPDNVRRRSGDAKANLLHSLATFGPSRSIVLDRDGVVRAGNGTLEAAEAAGCTEILVVRPAPGQIVAVRRDDWTPQEAVAYAVQDNRASDLSEDDPNALAERLCAIRDAGEVELSATGYDESQLDSLLEQIAKDAAGDAAEFDKSTPQTQSVFLKWPGSDVPMTEIEVGRLDEALAKHIEENGTPFGFVGRIIGV